MAKSNKQASKKSATVTRTAPGKAKTVVAPLPAQPQKDDLLKAISEPKIQAVIVLIICALTYYFLHSILGNQATNWDDDEYVFANRLVRNFANEGIGKLFFAGRDSYVMGNYHPITMLSYAIEYSMAQTEPWLYHSDSLWLHILNTALAYWLARLLSKNTIVAAFVALLFGLHPMHVESVAWIAGRKDLFYGIFFTAACIAHVYYLQAERSKRTIFYLITLLMFLCSLLSKPVAVTLPFTLILIDYLLAGFPFKEGTGAIARYSVCYIPHFAIALAFGILSIDAQRTLGALGSLNISYSLPDRLVLGCYALGTYLLKAIWPTGLSCLYPYPVPLNGAFPGWLYFYPAGIAALVFLVWQYARKNKVVVFGLLFFLVNIALLLQFVSVGRAIVADRYTYIPYFGLFFIAASGLAMLFEKGKKLQIAYGAAAVALAYCLVLGFMSTERTHAWYDSTSLWRDAIDKNPNDAAIAYNNLASIYDDKWITTTDPTTKKVYFDSVYYLLHKAIDQLPGFVIADVSLGDLDRRVGKYDEARQSYYAALKTNPTEQYAWWGLAVVCAINKDYDSAGICFRRALEIQPFWPEVHNDYGNFLNIIGKNDSSIAQLSIAIQENPNLFEPYWNRGRILSAVGRCPEAIQDFEKAIAIKPDKPEVYYTRSKCYYQAGDKAYALADVQKAISLGYKGVDKAYYDLLNQK
jgi:protein O-mannosyl-transferase